ncbi:FGGY-family carbohydrate kinase [Tessaracoccus palaemonis]|uniref:Class II aldolase/adducin family protein n=1 Tax=Tessaracoccus palaemonis TaxID=2829499 RepID=A0ABX8SJ44_9ACTN|nr:FGGY-family carbohydrate kinase [Tessaracoccus palaemonis]QXT62979.1 class II aldolase/adducin family protein [Tessaracoccus palaemonis]
MAVIAVDLGATSGRVVLATVADGSVALTEVHRFSTAARQTDDGLRLDIEGVFAEVQRGITAAVEAAGTPVTSVGIDCWAVDYGLLDADGALLDEPYNYRDPRTAAGLAAVRERIGHDELYARVGIQDNAINTINQLMHDVTSGRLARAARFLMLPDLIGYWLTGRAVAERTNASSTSLLSPVTRDWDWDVIDRLGLLRGVFPELVDPGEVVGTITVGAAAGVPLVAVGSHDTASAVVAAPLLRTGDVYLSSGTWSLIGMELDAPVLSEAASAANLTNEGGVDGTVRLLKNVMGMWILSEALRTWEAEGSPEELTDLIARAADVADAPRFDATSPALLAPGDMPARVKSLVGGDPRLDDPAMFTRSVLESLADAYRDTVDELVAITGHRPGRIAVVGGGCLNWLLCRLTAERTGVAVTAGPVEATAIGNVLVQARATGLITGTLDDLRRIVMNSFPLTHYLPRPTEELAVITALSNEFGADPAFTRAGGGNSSAKADGVLWIKPSGTSLATMTAEDLVPLDLDVLNGSLEAPDPDPSFGDPVNHIAGLARRDEGPRRPSVEILFHALIPDTYVLHTHPLMINAVTCNADGRELTARLFGDEVLWVDYVDPGLPLARLIKQEREAFTARTGQEPPRATFLMNHGLIVSGATPEEVRETSYAILGRIEAELAGAKSLVSAAEAFRAARGAAAVATDAGPLAREFPVTEAGAAFLTAGPLIPDQIVYAGSFPLVAADADAVPAALEAYRAERGLDPVVLVVPGVGVAAVGDAEKTARTALEVYVDALTVAEAASRLGSVRALDERERRFIETWEAEAYRKQVAAS